MTLHNITEHHTKIVEVPISSKINEDIAKALDDMLTAAPAEQYREAIHELYIKYTLHEHATLAGDFHDLAQRVIALLQFLKACENR